MLPRAFPGTVSPDINFTDEVVGKCDVPLVKICVC